MYLVHHPLRMKWLQGACTSRPKWCLFMSSWEVIILPEHPSIIRVLFFLCRKRLPIRVDLSVWWEAALSSFDRIAYRILLDSNVTRARVYDMNMNYVHPCIQVHARQILSSLRHRRSMLFSPYTTHLCCTLLWSLVAQSLVCSLSPWMVIALVTDITHEKVYVSFFPDIEW
jgi:hypothetical protein